MSYQLTTKNKDKDKHKVKDNFSPFEKGGQGDLGKRKGTKSKTKTTKNKEFKNYKCQVRK